MNKTEKKFKGICLISVMTLVFLLTMSMSALTVKNETEAFVAEITVNTEKAKQGSLLKVTAPVEMAEAKLIFAENKYSFQEEDGQAIALLPVSYWLGTKEYNLAVVDSEERTYKEWSISVQDGDFTESYLTVDQENKEKINPTNPKKQKRREKEQRLVYQVRSESSSDRLWEESFQFPLQGRVTTEFGATRYHNGQLANRHSGIDIAAAEGTPIKASNSGQVVLAHDILSTGKTIIIDHGWNVFSSYLHLSEIKVESGEKIERGEVIALLGETGFATGPHLHWSISIGRTFVNPEDFVELEL